LAFLLIFASCAAGDSTETTPGKTLATLSGAGTAVTAPDNAEKKPAVTEEGYTFEFSDSGNNYIISVLLNNRELIFTIEDRYYGVSSFIDSLPAGYSTGKIDASNCVILSDRFAADPKKELLQLIFYDSAVSTDRNKPKAVSKIYGIKDGVFMPLDNYDNTSLNMKYSPTIVDSVLLPTETNKYMTEPIITYMDGGNVVVTINTYTFDPNTMTFTKVIESTLKDNPLYYGYAAMSVCNDLYGYFVDKTLPIDNLRSPVAFVNSATGETENFFPVQDERFSTLAELESYVRRYFSEDIAAEMFRSAPQKYRDIEGTLYTKQVNITRNPSFGGVILTDALVEDLDIVYPVEQFITADGITALSSADEFIISTGTAPFWTAIKYSYPYK
jgi:hypothetical protein